MAGIPYHLELPEKAAYFLDEARKISATLTTAESCTGGLLSATLTEIPGASDILERGFITYSNTSKQELLGVHETLLKRYGAVSGEVAKAMAEGARANAKTALAVSITGIAGPGGGSEEKPVGTVYISVSSPMDAFVRHFTYTGDRAAIRRQATQNALDLLLEHLVLLSR